MLFPWDNPAPAKKPRFEVGTEITSGVDNGVVVEVNVEANTIKVVWGDNPNQETITYPMDASYIEDAKEVERMPWE